MVREVLGLLTPRGRRMMAVSIACFTVYALAGVAMMLVALSAWERVTAGDGDLLAHWVALIACLLVKGAANIIADKQKHCAGFDLVFEIRAAIVRRLKSFSLGFYTSERLGEIADIVHNDVDSMEMVVAHLWTRMASEFLVALILFAGLLAFDWRMGLLMASVLPVALALLFAGLRRAGALERECGDRAADMASLFVEYVKGIPLLKAFAGSRELDRRLESAIGAFGESSEAASRNRAGVLAAYGLLVDLAFVSMAAAGASFVAGGSLSLFSYIAFVVMSREFYKPFKALETHWANYLKVRDSYGRIKKVTGAPRLPEPTDPVALNGHSIEFDHVGFSYEEGGFRLADATFCVPEGTFTALVGESGSGKTTVSNLLLRFWDVDEGAVRIGGADIRDVPYDDLLASVSIVMQDVRLFADTIEGNIRIGRAGATREEVVRAAKRARIHDFVMTLPQGYDTPVGENGVGLSGGQRQRLSVARAFLKDAPILVLDEMTSSVDPVNEVLMQQAVSELARDRTVVVVAHHLKTIRSADQILVLRGGRIVQRGTHEALHADERGYYRRLWDRQSQPAPAGGV